jgi:hypothetical protein
MLISMSNMSSKLDADNVAGGEKNQVRGKKGEGDYKNNIFPPVYAKDTLRVFFFCPPKFCPCRGRLLSRCSSDDDPLSCKLRPRTGLVPMAIAFSDVCDIDGSLIRPRDLLRHTHHHERLGAVSATLVANYASRTEKEEREPSHL